MTPDVRGRLHDMLAYSEGAVSLVARHGQEGVPAEWGLQQGLIKALEVFGEAAWKIPAADRPSLDGLPWDQVAGLRHQLVHGYGAVRMEVLFSIVDRRLPGLISELKRVLEEPTA